MEVVIEKMNHQAQGIAKVNGKVVFVPKVIIGDIVDIDIIKEYKNYSIGRVNRIIKKSSKREEVRCLYYNSCGGCNISAYSYSDELKYKLDKVVDIFKRGGLRINPQIIESDNRYEYRNKITIQVDNGKIGLYEEESNKLVDINKCLLISDRLNEIFVIIKKNINVNKCNKIVLRDTYYGIMVIFYGSVNEKEVIKYLSDKVVSIYTYSNAYKLIYKDRYLYERIGDYKYQISPDSFFQVNSSTVNKLYNKVLEYATRDGKKDSLIDLYCGTGTIGIYLSKYFNNIIGIELNKQAIMDARENAKINNVNNITFYEGDVSRIINDKFIADVIVVDPPRSVLDKHTKNILLKIKADKIVYVSCNPITLVRDIKDLDDGYKLEDITLVDMFPNTYHVESVCVLNLHQSV